MKKDIKMLIKNYSSFLLVVAPAAASLYIPRICFDNLMTNASLENRIKIDEKTTFVAPVTGPHDYNYTMGIIDSKNLLRPTTAQVLSFLDFALSKKDEIGTKIISIFRKGYFWTSTENIAFSDGIMVYDNIDGKMPSDSKSLLDLFKKNDSRVRFVTHPSPHLAIIPKDEFLRHPYTIAQIGKEMIPTAKRVMEKLSSSSAYMFYVDRTEIERKRVTALYISDWNEISLDSYCSEEGDKGYSCGVLKS